MLRASEQSYYWKNVCFTAEDYNSLDSSEVASSTYFRQWASGQLKVKKAVIWRFIIFFSFGNAFLLFII